MYRQKKIVVVIPGYNVAGQIQKVIGGIPELVDEIIVVDDAASDGTSEVVRETANPRVTLVRHPVNEGVGGATVTGFKLALERGADVVVKMDGDDQMDPRYLPQLLDAVVVEGYCYAKGNRFLDQAELRQMPTLRLIGNFALTFFTKLASGYWHVFDPQNGFIAIAAATLKKLPLDRLARRYFFEDDMLVHLNVLRARVKDVAIPARYANERSSMSLVQVLATFPLHLFGRFWYRIYEKHVLREFSPVAVFWVLGSLMLAWGVGFGGYTWARSSVTGHPATTGTVMLSALPLILGFQLALQAILVEIQESPR